MVILRPLPPEACSGSSEVAWPTPPACPSGMPTLPPGPAVGSRSQNSLGTALRVAPRASHSASKLKSGLWACQSLAQLSSTRKLGAHQQGVFCLPVGAGRLGGAHCLSRSLGHRVGKRGQECPRPPRAFAGRPRLLPRPLRLPRSHPSLAPPPLFASNHGAWARASFRSCFAASPSFPSCAALPQGPVSASWTAERADPPTRGRRGGRDRIGALSPLVIFRGRPLRLERWPALTRPFADGPDLRGLSIACAPRSALTARCVEYRHCTRFTGKIGGPRKVHKLV